MRGVRWPGLARLRAGNVPALQGYNVEHVLRSGCPGAKAGDEAVALAWLLKHPARIQPIVGTVQPDRIRQAAAADQLELSREDWYRLLLAARGEPLP